MFYDSRQQSGRNGGPSTPPGGATPVSLQSSGSSLDLQDGPRTVPHATSAHLEALAAAESAGLVAPGSHALATAAASATARQLADSETCRMGAETALVAALEQLENERAATSAAEARVDALAEDVAMLRATLEAQNDALAAALEQVTHLKARLNAATASGAIQQQQPQPSPPPPHRDDADTAASPQAAPEEWELPPTEAQKAALAHTPPVGGHSRGQQHRSRSGSPISPPGAGQSSSTTPGGMSRRHVLAAEVKRAEEEDARESEGGAGSASETDGPGSSPDTGGDSGITPPGSRGRPPRGVPQGRKGTGKSTGAGVTSRDSEPGAASPPPTVAAQPGTPAAKKAAPPRAQVEEGELPGGGGGCFAGLFGRKRQRT